MRTQSKTRVQGATSLLDIDVRPNSAKNMRERIVDFVAAESLESLRGAISNCVQGSFNRARPEATNETAEVRLAFKKSYSLRGERGALPATARNVVGCIPSVTKSHSRRQKNPHRTYRFEKARPSRSRKAHTGQATKAPSYYIPQAVAWRVGVITNNTRPLLLPMIYGVKSWV